MKTDLNMTEAGRDYELQITPLYNRREKLVGRLGHAI